MTTTCPTCGKPCQTAEIAAYGRCEDCYNPVAGGIEQFGVPDRVQPGHRTTSGGECGGGHRVCRKPLGNSNNDK